MKKNIRLSLFIVIAGLLHTMWSTQIAAQEADRYSILDEDGDGFISIKEAVADPDVLAAFGKLDQNGDGKLSHSEIVEGLPSLLQNLKESTQ